MAQARAERARKALPPVFTVAREYEVDRMARAAMRRLKRVERSRVSIGICIGLLLGPVQAPGVFTTAAGYAGGTTPNPTYREVCSGGTGRSAPPVVVK